MMPTDKDLRRAAAILAGYEVRRVGSWYQCFKEGVSTGKGYTSEEIAWNKGTPNFLQDRNSLPELWARVERRNVRMTFLGCFNAGLDTLASFDYYWRAFTAEPRAHVIAALMACGVWPQEWTVGEAVDAGR